MKKTTSFFLLLFLASITLGQQSKIDSLKKSLSEVTTKKEKLSILDNLTGICIKGGNLKEGMPYFKEFSIVSKELKNIAFETKAYNYISEVYMKEMDSVNSISYAKKSMDISEKNNDLKSYLLGSNQLGRVFYHFRNFHKSIEAYEKGIQKFNKNKDEKLLSILSTIYSNSTWSYDRLGMTKESIEAVFKGIEIAKKTKSATQQCYGFYVLGYKYRDLNNFEKSEKYFKKSLEFSDSVSMYTYVNMNHHGLGILYSRWGKFDQAMHHNNKALAFYRKQGDKIYEFDVLHNIAVVYQRMNNSDSVFKYGNKALSIAEILNHKLAINGTKSTLSKEYIKTKNFKKAEELSLAIAKDTIIPNIFDLNSKAQLFHNLSIIYESQKKYFNSLLFYKKFKTLNDSIQKTNLESRFAELETKYQSEQKEKENILLKSRNAEQALVNQKATNKNWMLGFSLLILSIIAFFIWRRYKSEIKAKFIISNQKDEIENQKNMLLALQKELHHRMKNNLSFVDLFINLAKDKFKDKKYQTKLNELQNRMSSMFEIHKQLFNSNDITKVNSNKYLNPLLKNIEKAYQRENVAIYNKTNENEIITPNIAFPIGLIINEFVTNSYKYAFDEKEMGEVKVDLTSNEKHYFLNLSDNGKGFPKDFNIKNLNSFGLEIIQLLTKEYEGTFQINGNNGVSMNIILPKTNE